MITTIIGVLIVAIAVFKAIDANNDLKISKEELANAESQIENLWGSRIDLLDKLEKAKEEIDSLKSSKKTTKKKTTKKTVK